MAERLAPAERAAPPGRLRRGVLGVADARLLAETVDAVAAGDARRALELLGGNVVHFIPERLKDGYGLQPAAIERLHADGVALVISVDCGIRGAEAGRRARELGVDLIITDHHEPDTELPPALAIRRVKRTKTEARQRLPIPAIR